MKTMNLTIFKTGAAIVFAAIVGFGCGQQADVESERDTGTAEAIVAGDSSAANLNNPRPAPIGDTAETGNQADYFGDLPPNVDSAAREMQKLDKQKEQRRQQQQNPPQQ